MKKSLISLTALLMVGFMAASAFAWGHGDKKQGGCSEQDRGIYKDLTDDQKSQLRELHQQWVDESYEARAAMMTKHQELRMLMETSNPARSDIQALSDEIFELKKELADKRIDFALKAKKIAPEINFMGMGHRGLGKKTGHHPRHDKQCPRHDNDYHHRNNE
ncbi:MAG: hypothetical protein CSA25_01700 [Desulfobacter postgatei]|uniref:Zinc resistance-associated protein n=1 Tax=Desulfobacter postgatei TaxID=2293 RepID=A0A2G6MSW9_9BACT|nr:MAG: hypothetical protein CSA25_01700 [Desulfobacter postgatei]